MFTYTKIQPNDLSISKYRNSPNGTPTVKRYFLAKLLTCIHINFMMMHHILPSFRIRDTNLKRDKFSMTSSLKSLHCLVFYECEHD